MTAPASPYVACILVGGPHAGEEHDVPAWRWNHRLPPRIKRPYVLNPTYEEHYMYAEGLDEFGRRRFVHVPDGPWPRDIVGRRAERASLVPDDERSDWAPYKKTVVRDEAEYEEWARDTAAADSEAVDAP